MCYSALIKRGVRDVASRFGATVDVDAFVRLYAMREMDPGLKIPDGLEQGIVAEDGLAHRSITRNISRFEAVARERAQSAVRELESQIAVLQNQVRVQPAKTAQKTLEGKLRKRERLLSYSQVNKVDTNHFRLYPFYFSPVIIHESGERIATPMRYRVLPRTGVEVPGQYNVFNARRDSLTRARTWRPLFGRKHALFPFACFFEWVECEGKRREVCFSADGYETLWAACLYEDYQHPTLGLIRSFAMVTDEPPAEIVAAGHDRCPVFLHEDCIDEWLAPVGKSLEFLDGLLDRKQSAHFSLCRGELFTD